ncbi:MAG TPA: hypothetical protein VHX65_05325 [Pirellulales bacterium]|nr:hypothetical protein [Pirellulales bacterium]
MRPNVRKIEPVESNHFDEQLWPVNLALLLACGCAVGMIVALADFHTHVWYENGYFLIVALVGSVCGLTVLATRIGGRGGRRLQVAALLSISLHLVVGIKMALSHEDNSQWSVGPRLPIARRELREIDTLPDYQMNGLIPVLPKESDLEKPVSSSLPTNLPDQQPVQIVRNVEPEHPKPAAPAPKLGGLEIARPQARLAPALADTKPRPAESAAPRRGELTSTLTTRQPAPAEAMPAAAAIAAPKPDAAIAAPAASQVESHATPQGHQLLDPAVPRRPENDIVAMLPQIVQPGGPRAEAAPRAGEQQPTATIAVGPSLVKTMTEPAAVPRGEAPSPAAPARHEQAADQGAPRPATGAGRQAIAGPVVSRPQSSEAVAPAAQAPLMVAMASPVRPEALSPQPAIPNAGLTSSVRDSHIAGPVADVDAAGPIGPKQPPSVAAEGNGSGSLQAAATQVARVSPAASPARPAGPELSGPAGAGGFGVTVAMAGPMPGRDRPIVGPVAKPAVPGIGPLGNSGLGTSGIGSPALSAAIAGLPAAAPPGGIALAAGQAAPADSPSPGPAHVGIARATGGPVGPGHGEGFDVGLPSAAFQPNVSPAVGTSSPGGSVAARLGAGSGMAGGPAVGAGQPGGLSRTATTGEVTSGAVAIAPTGSDALFSSRDPGPANAPLGASSTAGAGRSTASGPIGHDNGLGGSGLSDIGPTQLAMNIGIGGGAGGGAGRPDAAGQPAMGLGLAGMALPRSIGGAGGARGISPIPGNGVAAAAAIPAGIGAGGPGGSGGEGVGPGGPAPESRASGAVRTARGSGIPGGAALAGGTSPGDGPGGLGSSGGAVRIGAAQIGRPGAGNTDLPGGVAGGVPGGIGAGIGLPGRPVAGGLAAEVKADMPQLPAGGGGPGGNGSGQGSQGTGAGTANGTVAGPVDAQVAGVARQSVGGIPGRTGNGIAAATGSASDTLLNGALLSGALLNGAPGVLLSGTGAPAAGISGNGAGGPSLAGTGTGALLPRNGAVGLPNGTAVAAESPKFAGAPSSAGPGNSASGAVGGAGGNGPGGPGGPAPLGPGGDGTGRRFGSAGLPTQAGLPDATGLAGGSGVTIAPQFGLPDRRARPDSDQLAMSLGRFLPRGGGGDDAGPEVASLPVRSPSASFGRRGRGPGKKGPGGNGSGGNKAFGNGPDGKTEETIERGLVYLARLQADDGHWSLEHFPGATDYDAGIIHSDTAATGLALLSFLGAGYDHYDDKYRDTVRRGLEFLLKHQKADGDLYVPMDGKSNESAWLYSHAIGSLALCEAFGMTGDPKLREPAQKSIDFIVASQNPKLGGWRYSPRVESDTSVTGWQTTAMKSGDLAGLKIPKKSYDRVSRWLDSAEVVPQDASRYVYNAENRNSQDERDSSRPTMTSVALLMRMYLGAKRDDPALLRGADFIKENLPKDADEYSRDTYYWYYATQVMFQLRGDYWKAWSERLHPLLVNSQIKTGELSGSWDPMNPVPDRWGRLGGRVYVTTMNLLSLEVYWRHLPIYEVRP